MLLRFGTSNFASFRDFQELSLVASSLKDDQSDLLESNAIREKLLAAAVIYGANAAGKSNLLQAFAFMRDMIVNSHSKSTRQKKIDPPTFALDPELAAKETKFDVDFILNSVRYHYGFTVNAAEVLEEWLYAYPEGKRQRWFYRYPNVPFEFGKGLRGKNRSIEALTRKNSLFLSAGAQNAHEQLSECMAILTKIFCLTSNLTLLSPL